MRGQWEYGDVEMDQKGEKSQQRSPSQIHDEMIILMMICTHHQQVQNQNQIRDDQFLIDENEVEHPRSDI